MITRQTVKPSNHLTLHTFKSHSLSDTNTNPKRQPSPVELTSPSGGYMFYSPAPKPDEESKDNENSLLSSQIPSLPHIIGQTQIQGASFCSLHFQASSSSKAWNGVIRVSGLD